MVKSAIGGALAAFAFALLSSSAIAEPEMANIARPMIHSHSDKADNPVLLSLGRRVWRRGSCRCHHAAEAVKNRYLDAVPAPHLQSTFPEVYRDRAGQRPALPCLLFCGSTVTSTAHFPTKRGDSA